MFWSRAAASEPLSRQAFFADPESEPKLQQSCEPLACWDTPLTIPKGLGFHGLAPFPWDVGVGTDTKLVAGAGVEAPNDLGGLGTTVGVDLLGFTGAPQLLQLHDVLGDAPVGVLGHLPGEPDGGVGHGLCREQLRGGGPWDREGRVSVPGWGSWCCRGSMLL